MCEGENTVGLRKRGSGTRYSGGGMDRGSKRQRNQPIPKDGLVTRSSNRLSLGARNVVERPNQDSEGPSEDTGEPELTLDEQTRFPSFNTRCTARDFVRAIKDFNARQKRAVDEIGMSGVLMLEITDSPLRLGRWLVTHFNPTNLSLELGGGKTIEITKEDVAVTLGIPLGITEIMCRPSQKVGRELRDWRSEMGKRDSTVTLRKVCEAMLSCKDGGDWFKRHFCVAVATIFIECTQNGYANQQFLHQLDDVERIRELDWCGYLLKRLVKTHHDWVDDMMQRFTGPVLFLTMLYLDRVVAGPRGIPRAIPAFIGWTAKLMREREFMEIRGGGFGLGSIDIPLREPSCANEQQGGEASTGTSVNEGSDDQQDVEDGLFEGQRLTSPVSHNQSFVVKFAAKTKLLAAIVVELVQMVNDAPEEIYDDINFKVVLEAAEKLLGMKRKDSEPHEPTSSQQDEAFWADPAHIAAVDEIEKAIMRKRELEDRPSFSLGLTQTQGGQEWHGFEDHAMECTTIQTSTGAFGATGEQAEDRHRVNQGMEGDAEMRTPPQQNTNPPPAVSSGPLGAVLGMAPLKDAAPEKRPQQTDLVSANLLNRFGGGSGSMEMDGFSMPSQFLLWRWVFNLYEHNNNEIMFSYNERMARMEDFWSLQFDTEVSVAVLDCWSCVLNEMEKGSKNDKPRRLFASTNTTMNSVVNATASRAKRLKWFTDRLDDDLALAPHINHATVDLFFFPILDADHCYVVCINPRTRRFDIIDNSSVPTTKKEKYKGIPDDLIDMFTTYLERKKQPLRAAIVSNLKPTRMRMPWRDTKNKVDCAIYTMRHMETYMGEACHTWDCGLEKGNKVQLRSLRQKYMHDILMSDLNSHRGLIIKNVTRDMRMGDT